MAFPEKRSCVRSLHAGMTDGAYKKAAPNRGGDVEDTTFEYRRLMSGAWHGFNESQTKVLPDGQPARAPYFADVTPQDKENI